ncbi:DDE superfamily endonuclease [Popillia japonica]|uniref:DDE superfamily endonuclease n=1 Tax=Popillia japonica TaxID=7064 RepID=A0AAW1MKW3_POPJA
MPRNYARTSNRQSWDPDSMVKAIEAVTKGEMGWLRASKLYHIPHATLRRHALQKNKNLKTGEKRLGRFKPTFPIEIERQLVEHLKVLESRNPDITLRKPEATSAARAQAFNKPQVAKFFKVLEDTLQKENIDPLNIYNADESALSTVQRPQKVFATAGRKQVGAITSAERGSHVTVVCCMCTNGSYIPPALIFPRKNMKRELTDHTPAGTLCIPQESGWMTGPVFLQWLQHFQKYAKSSPTEKVLLIVDGHSSHKYLDALLYAKENGIVLLCLPPHCTHRMQPLDVAFFGPLKTYYNHNQEITKWLKTHPGRVVTQFQIGGLLNECYGKAATVQNATHGFAKTGIYPINPDVFPDYIFQASETTNIVFDNIIQPALNVHIHNNAQPGPSSSSTTAQKNLQNPTSGQGKRKSRKRQGTSVLNSTPNLEEAKEKRKPKLEVPEKRKRAVKRKVLEESESETDKEPFSADEEDDSACIYCTELYKFSKNPFLLMKKMIVLAFIVQSCTNFPKKVSCGYAVVRVKSGHMLSVPG